MKNQLKTLIEELRKDISEYQNKEEALQKICRHFEGEEELSDDEIEELVEEFDVSEGELCHQELSEIEGYIAGLQIAVQKIEKLILGNENIEEEK